MLCGPDVHELPDPGTGGDDLEAFPRALALDTIEQMGAPGQSEPARWAIRWSRAVTAR